MILDLPLAVYDPARRADAFRRLAMVSALVITLVSGWQFLGLPGSPVKRNSAPSDMTGREYGLRDLYITADGSWTIYRYGYLDRMELYVIRADGLLERKRDLPDNFDALDVSGVSHGSPKLMLHGSGLDVDASPSFWYYVRQARPVELERKLKEPARSSSSNLPIYYESSEDEPQELPRYVPLKLFYAGQQHEIPVLVGHDFWPSYDSYAFVDGSLWLTTDRASWLHLLRCDDKGLPPSVQQIASVPLELGALTDRDVAVGRDPVREHVFILLADGRRYWFDAATLQAVGEDRLPGVWEQEYASLDFSSLEFNTDFGQPLSQSLYQSLMRGLVLLFLIGLLCLAFLWRLPWKYISVVTIVDTSSASKLSDTSQN